MNTQDFLLILGEIESIISKAKQLPREEEKQASMPAVLALLREASQDFNAFQEAATQISFELLLAILQTNLRRSTDGDRQHKRYQLVEVLFGGDSAGDVRPPQDKQEVPSESKPEQAETVTASLPQVPNISQAEAERMALYADAERLTKMLVNMPEEQKTRELLELKETHRLLYEIVKTKMVRIATEAKPKKDPGSWGNLNSLRQSSSLTALSRQRISRISLTRILPLLPVVTSTWTTCSVVRLVSYYFWVTTSQKRLNVWYCLTISRVLRSTRKSSGQPCERHTERPSCSAIVVTRFAQPCSVS
jgi:hypothetical protein